MNLRVLLVEDNPDDAALVLHRLTDAGYSPQWHRVATEAALVEALSDGSWDVALVDYNLPGFSGLGALRLLARTAPDVPAITVSGAISEETAVATITAGAVDYVLKDNLTRLAPAVQSAVEGAELRRRQRSDAERARRTQFAIDHSSQTIAYVTQDGTITYANAAAGQLIGASIEGIVGRRVWDWTPSVDQDRWVALWEQAVEHPPVQFETAIQTAAGAVRYVAVTLDHLGGAEGGAFVVVYGRDITEGRLAQESLRESEIRLEVTLESTGIAAWDWDVARDIWSASPQYYTMLGYEAQSGPADRALWLSRVHPDDREAVAAEIARVLQGGAAHYDHEARMLHTDGSYRWHRVLGRTVESDDQGNSIHLVGVSMDITESRLAGEALRLSEARLRALIDALPDLVWLKDPAGAYLSCNRRFEQFFGATEKDIVGKTDYDFVDRDLADFFLEHDRAAMDAGGPTANEEEIVFASDGHREILETVKTPVRAGDGRVVGVLGVGRDITGRKRAEEALRESEERFRRVSEATSDFAYSCVKPRGGVYSFDWLTGAVERITGWSSEDLLEWGCWKRLVVDDDVPVFESQVTGLAPGESGVCELRIRDRRGAVRWLAAYSQVEADAHDADTHRLHGACRDITEQYTAREEVRRQAERLRRTVEGAVFAMGNVVETRDPYTAGHERRVAELATAIAVEMGLSDDQRDALRFAALIHDIGKIAVPAEILAKPGRLSDVEFNLIRQHPASGFDILATIDFGSPVAEIVLQHHERLDGSGYPRALTAEQILPEARILALADVVEAMSSHRPYRPALGLDAALAEVRDHAGVRYDAGVAAACVRVFEDRGFEFTP